MNFNTRLPTYLKSLLSKNTYADPASTDPIYDVFSDQLLHYENQIEQIFNRLNAKQQPSDQNESPKNADTTGINYFICFINRSGSTLLTQALIRTKKMGLPGEMFNPEPITNVSTKNNLGSIEDYICWQKQAAIKNGGVFGAKVGTHQLAYLAKNGYLNKYFPQPKFIYITRKDILLQAISLYIASKTGAWTSNSQANQTIAYNHKEILDRLVSITNTQAKFEFFFAANGINPLRIYYEDLDGELAETLGKVCRFVDIPQADAIELPEIGFKKQRTDINYQWAEQFRSTYTKDH